jgi:TolB-like protein
MKKAFVVLCCLYVLGSVSCGAAEENKMVIAVADFSGQDISPFETQVVSEYFRTEMVNTGYFSIVNRSDLEMLLKEQKLQTSGLTDQANAVKIGKLLNARKMVTGTIHRVADISYINAKVVDVETGEIEYSEQVKCSERPRLPEKAAQLSKTISNMIAAGASGRAMKIRLLDRRDYALSVFAITPLVTVQGLSLGNSELAGSSLDGFTLTSNSTVSDESRQELGVGFKVYVQENIAVSVSIFNKFTQTVDTRLSLFGQGLSDTADFKSYVYQDNNVNVNVDYSLLNMRHSNVFAGLGIFNSDVSLSLPHQGFVYVDNHNGTSAAFSIDEYSDKKNVTAFDVHCGYEWRYKDVLGISITGSYPLFNPPTVTLNSQVGNEIDSRIWSSETRSYSPVELQKPPCIVRFALSYYFGVQSIFY